jgi:hypothetical protein
MNIWMQVLLVSAAVYSSIFIALLFKRRWTKVGLAVGIVHLLFALLFSVAPFRSLLDESYIGFGLGMLRFEGQHASLPAALILAWSLTAAYTAITQGSRRLFMVIAIGDALFALNQALSMALHPSTGTIQLGEFLTISGVVSLAIMALLFLVGPLSSGTWAWRRARVAA